MEVSVSVNILYLVLLDRVNSGLLNDRTLDTFQTTGMQFGQANHNNHNFSITMITSTCEQQRR